MKKRKIDKIEKLFYIKNIIIRDETWICGYKPETKVQLSWWKTNIIRRQNKARLCRMLKQCQLFFLTLKGLLVNNLYSQDQRQIRYSIKTRQCVYEERLAKNGRKIAGFFTITTRKQIQRLKFVNSMLIKKYLKSCTLLRFPDQVPCGFARFPKTKFALKGHRFQRFQIDSKIQDFLITTRSLGPSGEECFEYRNLWYLLKIKSRLFCEQILYVYRLRARTPSGHAQPTAFLSCLRQYMTSCLFTRRRAGVQFATVVRWQFSNNPRVHCNLFYRPIITTTAAVGNNITVRKIGLREHIHVYINIYIPCTCCVNTNHNEPAHPHYPSPNDAVRIKNSGPSEKFTFSN